MGAISARKTQRVDGRWPADLLKGGWTPIPNLLFEHAAALGLNATDQALLMHLEAFRRNTDDAVWPSVDTLARRLGLKRRRVLQVLKSLEERGLIERERRRGRNGGSEPTGITRRGLDAKLREAITGASANAPDTPQVQPIACSQNHLSETPEAQSIAPKEENSSAYGTTSRPHTRCDPAESALSGLMHSRSRRFEND